tara:strand:- start:879 stop:1184 length:306 start_codon:yes stop_codon:yes gene_type:complete
MENTTSNTSQDNNSKSQNEEIGAFWKRTSRNNMTYLAGHIKVPQEDGTERTEKVVVFSNQNKQNDKQPDYRVYVSNVEKRDGAGTTQSSSPQQSQQAEELL